MTRRLGARPMWRLLVRLPLVLSLFLVLCGFSGERVPDKYGLDKLAEQVLQVGAIVNYSWETCGEVNAYYLPSEDRVVMCNELEGVMPAAVVRYVFLHEAGHALMAQRHIPFTGLEEAAADEFAAWVLGAMERGDDVEAAARFWAAFPIQNENPFDPHPSAARRSAVLQQLADGIRGKSIAGMWEWVRVMHTWITLTDPRNYAAARAAGK